jgi:NAD+ synthetase
VVCGKSADAHGRGSVAVVTSPSPPLTPLTPISLTAGLHHALSTLRRRRRFDAGLVLQAKSALLRAYFAQTGLAGVVVGVSGGVDSAVALALCAHVARLPASPLRRVMAALLPIHDSDAATGQGQAEQVGRQVAGLFPGIVDIVTVPLHDAHASVDAGVDDAVTELLGPSSPWARGQLASTIRTPVLYHLVTRLTDAGCPACVVGTTNRDEGAFLGFFGKASDGMVDVQPIADLHKSEVRALGALLGVPHDVLWRTPTGDTFDGRTDTDMIGCDYDAVELFQLWRCSDDDSGARLAAGFDDHDRQVFAAIHDVLLARHRTNAHKYRVGSPAVFLDVLERAVPGGWRHEPRFAPGVRPSAAPSPGPFVGLVTPTVPLATLLDAPPASAHMAHVSTQDHTATHMSVADFGASAVVVDGLLSPGEVCRLREAVLPLARLRVDKFGRPGSGVGVAGRRCSVVDDDFAAGLWERLSAHLPCVRVMEEHTPTDHDDHPVWRPVGVNPYVRVLVGDDDAALVPHHDSTFEDGAGERRTLMSVLVCLPAEDADGVVPSTRFLVDGDRFLPVRERTFSDGDGDADDGGVLAEVAHLAGRVIVFDHRVRHEGRRHRGLSSRVVLRTDVFFERCASRALSLVSSPSSSSLVGDSVVRSWRAFGGTKGPSPAPWNPALGLAGEPPAPVFPTRRGDGRGDGALAGRGENNATFHEGASTTGVMFQDGVATSGGVFHEGVGGFPSGSFPRRGEAGRGALGRDPILHDAVVAAVARGEDPVAFALHTGFFDDGSDRVAFEDLPGCSPSLLTTPLSPLVAAIGERGEDDERPMVVALLTGALAPVHDGHVEVLKLAREALVARGCHVLGAILSPDHDDYVDTKVGAEGVPGSRGTARTSAAARLAMARAAVVDEPWIVVDPWAAVIADRSLPYTDILRRTERTLNHHLSTGRPIHTVLVCGGDNARFALAFSGGPAGIEGVPRVVVVPRVGAEAEVARVQAHPAVQHDPRLVFARGLPPPLASSRIRADETDRHVPVAARPLWRHWDRTVPTPGQRSRVVLRHEGAWALGPFIAAGVDEARAVSALEGFVAEVQTALHEAGVDVDVVHLADQRQQVQDSMGRLPASLRSLPVVSLDPCLPAEYTLAVSRVFVLGDHGRHGEMPALQARPGSLPLSTQLAAIPAGDVILADDDRATGRTIDEVRTLLAPRTTVRETVFAMAPQARDGADSVVDVLDLRDLLLGAREGGLVVRLPSGALARAPYLLPWVPPSWRLPVPPSSDLTLSLAIWRANARFFARLPARLTTGMGWPALKPLLRLSGWPATTPLLTVATTMVRSLVRP